MALAVAVGTAAGTAGGVAAAGLATADLPPLFLLSAMASRSVESRCGVRLSGDLRWDCWEGGACFRCDVDWRCCGLPYWHSYSVATSSKEERLSEEVQAFVEADSLSRNPLRELTRWLDANLEPEAEILVTDRLLVSYFQLYTKRTPLVREYLGVPTEALRGTYHLTTLSLRFYTPQRTLAEIDAAILAGRPVYLLSTESGSSPTVELPWGGLLLSRLTTPLGVRAETPLAPPSRTPVHATDLLSNALTLTAATPINPSVYRLSLRSGERTFSAKWKPLGVQGSEEQEGFDGNNAPRCELAARRIDQFLSDGNPRRELVPEVVLRALHRQVPCDRPCQGIPQLISAEVPATFAAINDHLVLGALSLWIEDAERPHPICGAAVESAALCPRPGVPTELCRSDDVSLSDCTW
jgi:hypothetical protein